MNLGMLFNLPGEVSNLVNTVKYLLNTKQIIATAQADQQFDDFVLELKNASSLLLSDVNAFEHSSIWQWLSEGEKLLKDFSQIGVQLVSAFVGLETDPEVENLLGTVLSVVKDVSGLLAIVGIKVAMPALSPVVKTTATAETPPVGDGNQPALSNVLEETNQ